MMSARLVLRLPLFAAVLVVVLASPAAACRLALLLAVDVSASVDAREFDLQRRGLAAALTAPEVKDAFLSSPDPVALAAFEWSGQWNQQVLLDWSLIESGGDLDIAARDLLNARRSAKGFPTSMGYALGYGARMLGNAPACLRKTIDVSGDGKNNHGFAPALAFRHFPLGDVTVNALAIGGAVTLPDLIDYFQSEVIQGPSAFVEAAQDHDDFERAMRRKLEREVTSMAIGMLAR